MQVTKYNKKSFIYIIYFLMGLIDFSFSRKLGIEMILFTVILISIKIYSAYVGSITTLIVTSILSIFLLYNNTNINYNHALQNNQEIVTKKVMLEQGIKNIDNQISRYWLSGNVLLELQKDRNKQLEELSILSSKESSNTTNPLILLLTMSVIYICLILLIKNLSCSNNKPKALVSSTKKCDEIERLEEKIEFPIKKISKEDLILEAKQLTLKEFTEKHKYGKSQYYNFKKTDLKSA